MARGLVDRTAGDGLRGSRDTQVRVAAYEGGAWVDMGHPEDDASLGPDDAPLVGESLWGGLVLAWKDASGLVWRGTRNQ